MSSPIGHSVAAALVYSFGDRALTQLKQKLWFVWLIVLASLPDLDYIVPFLNRAYYHNARVTHSFAFSLLLPICTIVGLWLVGYRGKKLKTLGLQAIAAGLSHLILDLLVGVTPLPLLFPLNSHLFKLPFGILPSSWTPDLTSYSHGFKPFFDLLPGSWTPSSKTYFLSRQIAIELGILLPWLWIGLERVSSGRRSLRRLSPREDDPNGNRTPGKIAILLSISLCFAIWAWHLPR